MIYCVDPNVDEPIMLISKHIGFDEKEGMGVNGEQFQRELMELDGMGKSRIQIFINSVGGIVMDGYNIYSAILKTKTKVDTYCVGIAASIAAVIFQAGRNRVISDYGLLMYHNPYGSSGEGLDKMRESIATMVASRTGKSVEDIYKAMDRTTWMSAEEAVLLGYADSIDSSISLNKKRIAITSDAKAMWNEGALVLNSLFSNKQKIVHMNKVTNKLGLVDGSNEDIVLQAITNLENKAKSAADKMAEMEAALKAKQEECDKMAASLDEFKKKAADAEKAKNEAEEAEAEGKAKNMVTEFAKAGRIKNDDATIAQWSNSCKTLGIDNVKAMIEALPISKAANKLPDVNGGGSSDAALTSVVALAMRDARNKMAGSN